jgi:hypothetical protein
MIPDRQDSDRPQLDRRARQRRCMATTPKTMPIDRCAPQRVGMTATLYLADRRRVRIRFVAVDGTHAHFAQIG